jgi:hypothetical protein
MHGESSQTQFLVSIGIPLSSRFNHLRQRSSKICLPAVPAMPESYKHTFIFILGDALDASLSPMQGVKVC